MDTMLTTLTNWFCAVTLGLFCNNGLVENHAKPVIQKTFKIVYIYDGDTVKAADGDKTFKLRLADIDAPEINQSYGKKAKRALSRICLKQTATIQFVAKDKYQRWIGHLQCQQIDVSHYMVSNGHAWANHYRSSNPLIAIEQTARNQQLGLWQADDTISPWLWRKKYLTRQKQ